MLSAAAHSARHDFAIFASRVLLTACSVTRGELLTMVFSFPTNVGLHFVPINWFGEEVSSNLPCESACSITRGTPKVPAVASAHSRGRSLLDELPSLEEACDSSHSSSGFKAVPSPPRTSGLAMRIEQLCAQFVVGQSLKLIWNRTWRFTVV